MKIYYDNSATTQVDPRVLEVMNPFLTNDFGNPSSIHSYGQAALTAVDTARDQIAKFLNCKAQEVIFTAGATESNNIAIQGTVRYWAKDKPVHIITTNIEHPSVGEVFKALEKQENIEVDYLKVDENGLIKLSELEAKLKDNTVLVSIMYANNEVGSVQLIAEIAKLIKQDKEKRKTNDLPLYFHSDSVQALNYLDCDVEKLGVDFLSFSGHKIYGPKGIGALYMRAGVKIEPVNYGGHHEYNFRPGTLNVPGIVGLGKAIELIDAKDNEKILKIKAELKKQLSQIPDIRFNGPEKDQLPNILNVSFLNAEGESLLMMLDMEGSSISTGSACSSGSLEPSPILAAMGIKPEWSHGSMRISLGRFNTEEEIPIFIKAVTAIVKKLRKMAP